MKINVTIDINEIFGEDARDSIKTEIISALTRDINTYLFYGSLRKYMDDKIKAVLDDKVENLNDALSEFINKRI